MSEKPTTTTRTRNRLNRTAPGMMRLEQRLMFDGAAADAVVEVAAPPVIEVVHTPLEVITPPAVDQQSTRAENLFQFGSGTTAHAELIGAATRSVQDRLTEWFSRDDYLTQAAIPFGAAAGSSDWSDNASDLRHEVLGGGYTLRLEIRSGAELEGALGAYSASGTSGRPTVYLNADWLSTTGEQALEAVLLEEVGHDLDQRLNGGLDSAGDEGHAFAALLLHGDANLQSGDDGKTIHLDGRDVTIEEAGPYNIAQVTFVPMPEAQLNTALTAIFATNANSNIETIISITSTSNNTQIVYDHWEDGYEADLRNPLQASTQIWGDGDLTNGTAPGTSNDLLNASQTVLLRNTVAIGSPNTIDYDGRDKIGSSKAIAVTRAGWNQGVGTIVAGAVNLVDVGNAGKTYVLPIGENVGTLAGSNAMLFEYTSIHVMAFENGTTINIDKDGNGTTDQTLSLNQGEAALVDVGVIRAGARVTADKGIGVYVIAGDAGASENRWFGITPLEQWATSYYAPVATVDAVAAPAHIFLHNANASAITVFYDTKSSTGNSIVVAANSTNAIQMPASAAHFYTTNGAKFYAVGTIDSGNSSTTQDWSYSLVPESYLTDKFVVAWGPGSSSTPPSSAPLNGSPVWVTSAASTWLYVDSATVQVKRSDGTLVTGETVDADTTRFAVATLESYRLSDTSDKDQTGLVVYTLDGTLITAAWGEDPSVAGTGAPYLDMGTTVLPYPDYVFRKVSTEASPVTFGSGTSDGDTLVELNEQIEYSITVANRAVIDLFNVNIKDALTPSDSASYVAGSANLTVLDADGNVLLYNADLDGAVNSFPLAGAGYTLTDSDPNTAGVQGLQRGHQIVVKYRVQVRSDINQAMADDNYVISNTATLAGSPPVGDPIDPKSTTRETKVSAIDARPQSVVESSSVAGSTFKISNLVGLTKITVGTTDVTLAQLTASGTVPIGITTAEGSLTISGYNSTTGVVTYAYDPAGLSKNHSAGAVTDNVALSATYSNGAVVTTTLTIAVTDTAPIANADVKRITENSASVGDNVVSGPTSADTLGSDATTVTGIVSGSVTGPLSGGVGSSITGAYGSISLASNGAYTYLLDNANPAINNLNAGDSLTDVFSYTVTDSDGDTSTTQIAITIDGVSDTPPSLSVNDVTVNEAAGTLTFTMTRTGALGQASTVDYATADGVAVAGADYTATSGTLSFVAGETSKTVIVSITNDSIFESSEAFSLDLSNAINATIADGAGVATIRDDGTGPGGLDNDRPSFSVDDVTVNEAAGTLTFTVIKTGATALASTVDYASTAGTATSGADYTATSGTLSFLSGETSKTVSVAITNDNVYELSEAFDLNLSNASNAVIADGLGIGTIKDDGTGPGGTDDDRPSFSVNDVTVNEAAGTLAFTVTKTGSTALASSVDFASADGTATAAADYIANSGTLSFLAGETSKTVSVAITNDNVFELSEAFSLNLSNAGNAVIADGTGVGAIKDDGTAPGGSDDDRPSFAVNDVTVNEATGTLTFTVTKTGSTALASSVDFATGDGTASAGMDYTATSGTLSFLAGETSKAVSIAITNDNVFELSEAFSLNLSNAVNAVISDGLGIGTIKDDGTGPGGSDDDRPSFSVNDVTVNEAAGTLSFTVTKSGATALTSFVDFATANGTATAGDYTAANGTLSFLAGETSKTVSVAITNDNVFELSEAFSFALSNAGNALIADGTGSGTIKDDGTGPGGSDDDRPSFSVNDVTVNEAAGTLSFTVTKAGATSLTSAVDFATADGTASAGADYTAASGTLSFLAGESSKAVSVAITNDNVFELSEAFSLNLSNASNALIADGIGGGTIKDDGTGPDGTDDDRPSLSVNDVTVNEAAGTLSFTVTKTGATTLASSVDFATADGAATAGADYTSTSGTLSFLAGETSKTVSIAITNDNVFELSEAFSLNLSNASNAVINDGVGIGTVKDDGTGPGGADDDRPSFSVNDVTVNEAAGTLSFTVTKAGATTLASSVDFATTDGTATAGADYDAASGTLSFLAGETSKTVSIAITNDNLFELSEAFSLNLSNTSDAVVGDGLGIGTIKDDGTGPGGTDDDRPSFSVNDVTVNEAAGTLTFTVSKSGTTGLTSTVDFSIADGTATAGADYTGTNGTLSFLAVETSKTISIAITDDNVFELSEAFSLNLSNAGNAIIGDGMGIGTIKDDGTGPGATDDDRPSFSVNDVTVNEAAGTLTFTVTKSGATVLASTVDFATANGTATSSADYNAANGTLSFLAGETSRSISIAITNDNVFELSEAFSLNLSNAASAVIGDGVGVGTIQDDGTGPGGADDDRPSFSVNDVTVNEAAGTLSFTVTKSGATTLASTVDFATVDGTATAGADYTAATGTLGFLAGETSKTVSIAITNDNVFELLEAFSLNLSNAGSAVIADSQGLGTIKDDGTGPGGSDDDRPSFSIDDVTVNEAAGMLTFSVTKAGATTLASTVDFATANDTAVAGADYTATSGTLSFLAGESSKTVSVAITNDNVFELSEGFNLTLSNVSNAIIADVTGVGTVKDDGTGPGETDDDRPSFSVNDVTVNEAAGTLSFTVTKTGATTLASSVDFATADGTATAGADYTATSGTLSFLSGETTKTVSVPITDDNAFELSEAFSLNLSNAGNAVIADGTGVGTIKDDGTGPGGSDDDRPSFSVNDVTVNEGAGTLSFTITKSGTTGLASSVDFATADGTATAGADYTVTSGSLSFLAGETSKTVSIAITNDNVFELSEAFSVDLSNAGNAVIGDGTGIGTIKDDGTGPGGTDDDRPSFSVDDVTVNEAAGTLNFTVTKAGSTTLASTVDFVTVNGSATAGADYTAANGTLSFLAGETSRTVSIAITNDNVFELSEAFSLNLSNAGNAVISDGTGVGTIKDDGTGPGGADDDRPSFSVDDVTVNEAAGTLTFTVIKSGANSLASTVDFATASGTATAGADYTATSGTLSFLAGETSKTVSVAITNDNVFELSEAFSLNLSNAVNAVVSDGLGIGTIKDDGTGPGGSDDDRPSFSVNDVTVNEAAGTLSFTVTKSGATALTSFVDFATANGTATAGDYTAANGTLSFLSGETSKTVSIAITNDNAFELSEAFSLNLSNAGNAVIADGTGVGTIKDDGTGPGGSDDDRPSFSVNDVTVNEAAGTLSFTVTKTGGSTLASSVDFATADGTTTAGADYTAASGTLAFLAGETSKTVTIAITNDNVFELSEAFSLNVSNAGNAVIADGTGVGTIKDDGTGPGGSDDDRPSFSVNDVTVNEAAGTLSFTITKSGATGLASSVDFSTADGAATAGADYTATSGTLSFLAGETSKAVSIAITNDNVFELSEAFSLNLSNAGNAVVGYGTGVGTIKDDGTGPGGTDDDRPSFSVNDVMVNEAAGTLTFMVTKSGTTGLTSTVDFSTADETAIAGADYTATIGTLSFLAGEASKSVSIAITDDNIFELSEAFSLDLSNAGNAVIGDGSGVGTIRDDGAGPGGTDDDRPSFSVNDVTVNEAAGTLTFTVAKSGTTGLTSTVDFSMSDGTATAGADYTAAYGTLSFLAGENSKTVSIAITNDNLFELSEAFSLNLSNAGNAVIGDGTGVGTIKDDGTGPGGANDDRPTYSVNDVTVNEAAGTLTFTVTKSGATSLTSNVDFVTASGTATAGADYTASSGTLSFLAGENTKTISVAIGNDNIFELSEAFSLDLGNAANAVIGDGVGVGTIKDDGTGPGGADDDRPSFSVEDVTVNEAAGTLTFTVTKSGATTLASTVDYTTTNGTASAAADYTATSDRLSFLSSETSKTVSIAITNDDVFELSEAFSLTLSNAGNAVIGDGVGIGTIKDDGTGPGGADDDRPSFSVDDFTVNEAAGTLTFTVTKSGSTALTSTVGIATANVTATAGSDYAAAGGTLSFLAGEASKTVSLAITNDNVFELSEAFSLNLSNAGNAVIGDGIGIGTIKDDGTGPGGTDDDRPSFSVNDVAVNEAAGTLTFTVTKSGATALTSTVDYTTTNGTASTTGDYTATSDTLSFLAGETSKTVSVAITNDNVFELSEAFSLNLSNAGNAVIGDGTGVGTIKDDGTGPGGTDDDRPSFSLNDVTVNEAAGTLTFTVTKSGSTGLTSTVDFATADGTAAAGADYTATSGTLSFLAGETSKTVTIAITNDNVFELSEAFNLNLSNAADAVLGGGSGLGTIKDDGAGQGGTDDDRPSFSVNDVTVNEAAGTLTFTVTKSGAAALASTVDFATTNGTATAGADYDAANGTLSFLTGETSKTVSVAITNDNLFELSEAFSLNLSNAVNAIIGDGVGIGTIKDDGTGAGGTDDDRPSFSVNDVTVNEAAGTLSFTVTKTGATTLASSVDFATADGTATAGADYTATSGTLGFLAGETSKTVSVAITNDNVFELSEAFSLNLSNASNAAVGDGLGIGTSKDDGTGPGGTDDDRPSFSVKDVTVNEAAGTLTFTVTKSGATTLASSVDFATVDATATAGADYTASNGALSFLAGETSKTVSIAITNDNVFELSEAFSLHLSNAAGAVIGDGVGSGTIKDDGTGQGGADDDRPSFSVNDLTVNEAAETLTFTVTKSGATALTSTVAFATANGTATARADYTATSGTLSFLAGETSKTVSITITNDNVFELTEAFSLDLRNAGNAVIGDGTGVGTIKDDGTGPGGSDDDRPSFSVNDVTVNEAAGTLTFTVTKSGSTSLASSVEYATADGTATAGADYTAASGTLSFLAGETRKTVSVAITNDNVFELSEAFSLNLRNPGNALIADGSGAGTLKDDGTGSGGSDDDRPSFSVNDVQVNEAAGTLTFTVTKAGSTTLASSVDFATVDGTATAGADYTAARGTLSFLAGESSKTVSIRINNDNIFELSEAFTLDLSNAGQAHLGTRTGLATIKDDGTGPGGLDDDRLPPVVQAPPAPVEPAPPGQPVTEPLGRIETLSEFPILAADLVLPDPRHDLTLERDIPDQPLPVNGTQMSFTIPTDTFLHTDTTAQVSLAATMVDGTALPSWLKFDPATGSFSGTPPRGLQGELQVKVLARDDIGRQAETIVRIASEMPVPRTAEAVGGASDTRATTSNPSTAAVDRPAQALSSPAADQRQLDTRSLPASTTTLSGFQVLVDKGARNASDHELRLNQSIPDQVFPRGLLLVRYQVPVDAFIHTDSAARVVLSAAMIDGSELPQWLQFKAEKGEFKGMPPLGFKGDLLIKVIARDGAGRQAETIVRISIGESADKVVVGGKPALSAQMRPFGIAGWKAERDRLVAHAHEATVKARTAKAA